MRIAVGSDHAGFALKEAVKVFLTVEDREVLDLGTHRTDPVAQLPSAPNRCHDTVWRDYSDYAEAVRPPSTSSSCRREMSTSWWSAIAARCARISAPMWRLAQARYGAPSIGHRSKSLSVLLRSCAYRCCALSYPI